MAGLARSLSHSLFQLLFYEDVEFPGTWPYEQARPAADAISKVYRLRGIPRARRSPLLYTYTYT